MYLQSPQDELAAQACAPFDSTEILHPTIFTVGSDRARNCRTRKHIQALNDSTTTRSSLNRRNLTVDPLGNNVATKDNAIFVI